MKPNKKLMRRVAKLDTQIQQARTQFNTLDKNLRDVYGIPDTYPAQTDRMGDNYWDYDQESAKHYCAMSTTIFQLHAQQAALILLAYHIARRGKPLHQIKIERNKKKLGQYADFVMNEIKSSRYMHSILGTTPYLHRELNKYGITLLDFTYMEYIQDEVNRMNMLTNTLQNKFAIELAKGQDTSQTVAAMDRTDERRNDFLKQLKHFHAALRHRRNAKLAAHTNQLTK